MGIDRSATPDRVLARLRGERALEREAGRLGAEFELLADAVEDCAMFLLDGTGHVRTWNTGGERVVGYTSDEIVGEHVSALYRDEDVEVGVPDRHLREAAAEGYVEEECWRVRADGSAFRADVTIVALREEGELTGYAVVAREGDRRHREQALLERTEHLEDLVASISHDLRTPLAVAEGNVDLAIETGDLSRLEATTRALDRATDLLDDLARLAEEGSWVTDPEPVDLREVATAAWRSVETDEATFDVDGSSTVVADRQRLRQLLENLLANSVEHGSTGSRTQSDDAVEHAGSDATVSVGPLEKEGEEGLFFVEDDGPGIPEAERTEVFERGYSDDPDGTGFGLAICERIADAHGWAIEVTDGSDGGARFEVSVADRG